MPKLYKQSGILKLFWNIILYYENVCANISMNMIINNFKFSFKTLKELKNEMYSMGIDIPISKNVDILKENIEKKNLVNKLAIQPMEGCDCTNDGRPGELTIRRYKRYAKSGAGILWFEGTAVTESGRSNPRQLLICEKNKRYFKKLLNEVKSITKSNFGYEPYMILQLTHSGRYSNPKNNYKSKFVHKNPYLNNKLKEVNNTLSDEEISEIEDKFVDATKVAKESGFDAIDIKSCHGYLISELLSAFSRKGKYGGTFENRIRFLVNIIDKIRIELGNSIDVAIRINAYDGIPYPYGWGIDKQDYKKYDLEEPIKLIKLLYKKNIEIINISVGDPHHNPHIVRPYDIGFYKSPEHPLMSVYRLLKIAKEIQKAVPGGLVIASGLSWLREFGANVAAGCIRDGWFSIAGFGRQAFAYPNFARDIIKGRGMVKENCCISCSKCTEIMRGGGMTGCVIKDSGIYAPIYKKIKSNNISTDFC